MAAPVGNKFWEHRSSHGRDKLFATPQLLWEAAVEYFEWCQNTPLMEVKGFAFQGMVTQEEFPKMRAMTLSGLCLYLGCSDSYFRVFKLDSEKCTEDFLTVIENIERTIYLQKFTGAAADLLNANIISRELGLADRNEITGRDGVALFSDKTDDELKQLLADTLSKLNDSEK